MEMNLVELWLRRDPARWIAGVLTGLVAGLIALVLAMVLSAIGGRELWFPAKLFGAILLGTPVTAAGTGFGAVIVGLILYEAICGFFGFVFAHFVPTNSVRALLMMGLVWAAFSWIFLWNLFLPSFNAFLWANVSSGVAFPICLAFGLSLALLSVFDRSSKVARG
jgi:hypothetical protein